MWVVEAWDRQAKVWRRVRAVDNMEEAKKACCFIAQKGHVTQATLPKAEPGEYHCMRAYPGRGWSCWTGSGGLLG